MVTHRPNPRMFQAIGRLNRARSSLMGMIHDNDTLPELRAAVLELASDIESFINGAEPASEIAESRRDTEPCPPPYAEPSAHVEQLDADLRPHTEWPDYVRRLYVDTDEPSAPAVPVARPSGGP